MGEVVGVFVGVVGEGMVLHVADAVAFVGEADRDGGEHADEVFDPSAAADVAPDVAVGGFVERHVEGGGDDVAEDEAEPEGDGAGEAGGEDGDPGDGEGGEGDEDAGRDAASVGGDEATFVAAFDAELVGGVGHRGPPAVRPGCDRYVTSMPRLRQIPKDEAHELAQTLYSMLFGDRDPVAEPGTATGSPGNWWTVTALVPELFDHIVGGFGFYRSPNRLLDPQLRELGQTRAGFVRGSRFVYSQHVKACREVGLSEEKIEAVRAWSVADVFSPVERAVLAYTDALVLQGGRVPDEVFEALRAGLSEEEILELSHRARTTCMRRCRRRCGWSSTMSTIRSRRCRARRVWARRRWMPCALSRTSTPGEGRGSRRQVTVEDDVVATTWAFLAPSPKSRNPRNSWIWVAQLNPDLLQS